MLLSEIFAHLLVDIMLRSCGIASAGFRLFFLFDPFVMLKVGVHDDPFGSPCMRIKIVDKRYLLRARKPLIVLKSTFILLIYNLKKLRGWRLLKSCLPAKYCDARVVHEAMPWALASNASTDQMTSNEDSSVETRPVAAGRVGTNAWRDFQWVFTWLGSIVAILAVVGVFKSWFDISLTGLPLAIYENYAFYRDIVFSPLAWLLSLFDWSLPAVVKDLMTAYFLLAAAYSRAENQFWDYFNNLGNSLGDPNETELNNPDEDESESVAVRAANAVLSLAWPAACLRKILIVTQSSLIRGVGDMEEWTASDILVRFRNQIVILFLSASAFFLCNHLQSLGGPGTSILQ